MTKIKINFYTGIIAIIALASFFPIIPAEIIPRALETKVAQAAIANPDFFQVSVKDHQCSDQEGYSGQSYAGGINAATDSNAKDPDCGRIFMNGGTMPAIPVSQSIYSNDFRIGTKLAESESGCNAQAGAVQWTPWASEGGGASWGATAGPNVNDPDCLWIYYETRPLPSGILIKDVRAGVSTGNGPIQYTPWARCTPVAPATTCSAGGWSGYSGGGNISPARVALDVQFVEVYDAEYVSDTVPSNMDRNASGTYNIVMRNKATAWSSDIQYPNGNLPTPPVGNDNCQGTTPVTRGQICETNPDPAMSSSKFKLKLVGSDPGISIDSSTSAPLIYKRVVHRTYQAGDICLQWGVASAPSSSKFAKFFGIKSAEALPREPGDGGGDPGGDPGPVCTQWGLAYYQAAQSPSNSNIVNTDTASFPIKLNVSGSAANGNHTLVFRMVNLNSGEEFGSQATINIAVGSAWTLNCNTLDQTVNVGESAFYALSATGATTETITISMTSDPDGPSLIYGPVLDAGNGYFDYAEVGTGKVEPGTYQLTFTGDDTRSQISCNALLTVIDNIPVPDIKFQAPGAPAPEDGPVSLNNNVNTGTITWDSINADSCTASTTSDPAGGSTTPPWSGSVARTGSSAVTNITYGSNLTLRLTCQNGSGAQAFDEVQVIQRTTPPVVDLKCVQGLGNNDGPCTVVSGTSGYLTWVNAEYADSCSIDHGIGAVSTKPPKTAISTGPVSVNTTFRMTCTGPGGTIGDNTIINVIVAPQAPTSPSTSNQAQCGKIDVNWVYNGPPTADGFEVYRAYNSSSGPWSLISPLLGSGIRTFRDNSPAATSNYYYVKAYHDGLTADSVPTGPVAVNPCAANLDTSDKDLIQLQRGSSIINTVAKPAEDCNGPTNPDIFKLPGNGIFRSGDIVTFKVNVCNSGNQVLSGISVQDTMANLTSPSNFTFSQLGGQPCGSGGGTGTSFSFDMVDLNPGQVCSVTFKARITAPAGPASLFRFMNTAVISSDQVSRTVSTPPYLFQVGAGTPIRNETNR